MKPTVGTLPATLPSIDALVQDPSRFNSFTSEVQDAIYERVLTLEARLRAKILTRRFSQIAETNRADLVLVEEASALLKTSRDSLYSKWSRLPFAYKDPIDGRVKFSRSGIEKYISGRLS